MKIEYHIKNMVCDRCIKVVRNELIDEGVEVEEVELGRLLINSRNPVTDQKLLIDVLNNNGFELINSQDQILVETIKLELIRLLKNLPVKKQGTLSKILADVTRTDYSKLSKLFSVTEKVTIEKYFIKLKIEKVKELIQNRELNFTEISQLLDYSNVNYLSRQFKSETGMSLTQYKNLDKNFRNSLDQIV